MIRILSLVGLLMVIGGLSACGRVSKTAQPDNSFYPHTYYVTNEDEQSSISQKEATDAQQKGETDEKNAK